MNPDFVTDELNRLEISSLVKDLVKIDPPPEIPNLNEIIYQTVSDLEPQFKVQSGAAIHSVYAYLLGESRTPDLKSVLRKTFLSTEFITPLVNSIPISTLAGDAITQQFAKTIPIQIPNLDKYVNDILAGSEPALKAQAIAISGPVFDYLLGTSQTLSASISLKQIEDSLKTKLLQVFLDSPQPELAIIPRDLRQTYFNQFYDALTKELPANYTIDESIIQPKLRADIASGISSSEDKLKEARRYVAIFQQYYTLLLVFMALMALGIILIVRNVKDITHRLGIPLLTYGAMEYAGVLVSKYLISSGKMQFPEIPPQIETWLLQLINNSLKPLETFSLILLIAGVVLTVISFLYKPKQDLTWS